MAKSLSEEADFPFECGISKITWLFSEKEQLKLLLCKYNVIYRAKASLDQFAEGLQTVGLLPYIKGNARVLREVLCHAPAQLTCASFRNLLSINFTVPRSNSSNEAREAEEATILWWEEYLDKLERSDEEGLLRQLLIFITGADNIPVLGFHKMIEIDFFNYQPGVRRFPTASTCSLRLTLPRGVPSYEEFESLITQALREGSHDFGQL